MVFIPLIWTNTTRGMPKWHSYPPNTIRVFGVDLDKCHTRIWRWFGGTPIGVHTVDFLICKSWFRQKSEQSAHAVILTFSLPSVSLCVLCAFSDSDKNIQPTKNLLLLSLILQILKSWKSWFRQFPHLFVAQTVSLCLYLQCLLRPLCLLWFRQSRNTDNPLFSYPANPEILKILVQTFPSSFSVFCVLCAFCDSDKKNPQKSETYMKHTWNILFRPPPLPSNSPNPMLYYYHYEKQNNPQTQHHRIRRSERA